MAFYHAIPIYDNWYDENKDVFNGELVLIDEEDEQEGEREWDGVKGAKEGEHSLEELFDPL